MSTKPILVIGDSCKDVFVYCHCSRLSPEAPVPVLDVVRKTNNLGMAGNVYSNIIALNCAAEILTNSNHAKVTKTRYIEEKNNYIFIRIDSNEKIKRIENLRGVDFQKYSAVIVADYNKGFLQTDDIKFISESHHLTFLDTKKTLGKWADKITFIKINRVEYQNSLPFLTNNLKKRIIRTLGDEGCEFRNQLYPVNKVEVKNLSGAGDTFLAALVVKYVQFGDIGEALQFANEAATKVVQKIGVATVPELALKP